MTLLGPTPVEQVVGNHPDEPELREHDAGIARMNSYVPPGLDLAVLETAMIAATLALLAGVLL